MKRLSLFFSVLLMMSTAVVFSGCSDEKEDDLRDHVIGTFSYDARLYVADATSGELEYLGAEYDINNGRMEVKKNKENPATIDFFENGELSFQGSKITAASNGIVFDIPKTTIEDMDLEGYDYVDLEGTLYHGVYYTGENKIIAAMEMSSDLASIVMIFTAVKE